MQSINHLELCNITTEINHQMYFVVLYRAEPPIGPGVLFYELSIDHKILEIKTNLGL